MKVKSSILNKFVKLRAALAAERAALQTRLSELDAALGIETAPQPAAAAAAAPARGKRKLSAANKAKLIAGIKARWARYRAEKGTAAVAPQSKPAKRTFKMSAAGRARIIAAQKARWAKVRAAKGK